MTKSLQRSALLGTAAFALAVLAAGCGPSSQEANAASSEPSFRETAALQEHHPSHEHGAASYPPFGSGPPVEVDATAPPWASAAADPAAAASRLRGGEGTPVFTGTREETAELIGLYRAIRLTPAQERIKVEALSSIPAPCCDDNPLATCCCPCNMAKAAWGLAAWLITEKGYGADELHHTTLDWLRAANPDGFAGNACYTPGGCARPIHRDGCGGMDERRVT